MAHVGSATARHGRLRLIAGAAVVVTTILVSATTTGELELAVATSSPATTSTTVAASASAPTTTILTPTPRTATLAFSGDVLIHTGVWEAARTPGGFDFGPMFAPVRDRLSAATVAICHLEVTLARTGERPSSYPRFRAPRELAAGIAGAGFDGCSVSSNHALDFGASGVDATLAGLEEAGLRHAGTARSPEEDGRPAVYDAGGIAVAHLSYAYGFNGYREPADKPYLVDQIDPAVILADARAAGAAGAELVVVSMHWGNEYTHQVTTAQQRIADALAAEPGAIDLIVGHHAHVVQPISRVGSMWVVWGMGNMLSDNSPERTGTGDGVIVTVTIGDEDGDGVGVRGITYTPTWNERNGFRVLPAAETLARGALPPALTQQLRSSFDRTSRWILERSGLELGVRPDPLLPG